jgi:hypothetical protein
MVGDGVMIMSMANMPLGFDITASLTHDSKKKDMNNMVVLHQADTGEGPIRRPERGSEWDPIKILLQRENSAYATNS